MEASVHLDTWTASAQDLTALKRTATLRSSQNPSFILATRKTLTNKPKGQELGPILHIIQGAGTEESDRHSFVFASSISIQLSI